MKRDSEFETLEIVVTPRPTPQDVVDRRHLVDLSQTSRRRAITAFASRELSDMSVTFVDTATANSHPLDLLEEIVGANDWAFDRASSDELAVEISGRWCDYRLYFLWQEDLGALHFSCLLESKVPIEKRKEVSLLLALLNEKLWLGHFDLSSDDGTPMFRHTLLMRSNANVSVEQMEDLVEVALHECERFFPAFQFVIWGGKSADEAISCSLLDVVGEA